MPWTTSGRYYRMVNGRRRYDPSKDRIAVSSRAPRRTRARTTRTVSRAPRQRQPRVVYEQVPVQQQVVPYQPPPQQQQSGDFIGDLGSTIGRGVFNFGKRLLGFGDYKIKSNVFLHGRLPQVFNMPQGGGIIIRFQEYLGDVITSSSANTFSLQSYHINPGLVATFPQLSQNAQNYEQYSFEGLVFEFRSTSADALNSTNTALGTVMMATNYDSSDPVFASKGEMLNYEFSTSCKPSENVLHMIECEPSQTVLSELYTRSGAVPTGDDKRMYDLGLFQIATTGFQGTSVNIGELHCTYQVRLMKPKLHEALGEAGGLSNIGIVGADATHPLGTSNITYFDNIGITVASTSITLPILGVVNSYRLYWQVNGSSTASLVAPVVTFTNATVSTTQSEVQVPASGGTATRLALIISFFTIANGLAPLITFGTSGTLPASITSGNFFLAQIPNSAVNT